MDLRRAAASGTKWTAFSSVLVTAAQFIQIVALARLLSPRDFGVMAMVMIIIGYAQTFTDMGISNAIIYRQDSTPEQLSSLYWLNVIAGALVFAFTLALMPVIVPILGETRLYQLIPFAALLFLIAPIGQQFQLLLQKELRFDVIAFVEIFAATVSAITAIAAALKGLGVFSIVVGQLAAACVAAVCYAAIGMRRWRPALRFQFGEVKDYLSFGLFQLGARSINFINARVDQLLIGIILGPAALGFYTIAWNLIVLPVSKVNPILTRVAFPVFAKVQHDNERLKRGYMMLIWLLSAANAPVLFGCAVTAPLLVPVLYGNNWSASVHIVEILAAVGFIRSVTNSTGALMLAKGRADLGFYWILKVTAFQIACVYLGARFGGLDGVAIGVLVVHVGYLVANYPMIIRRLLGPCLGVYVKNIAPCVLIAALMALVVWPLPNILSAHAVLVLCVQIAVGGLLYTMLIFYLQRSRVKDVSRAIFAPSS